MLLSGSIPPKASASFNLTPESAAKVHDGTVELAKDESADIAFSADKPGTYEMHCTHPLHAMLGMKGQIVIH